MKNFRFLIRLPETNKFEFTPRYYDQEKEDLQKRVRAAAAERQISEEEARREIKFSEEFSRANRHKLFESKVKHQKNMANLRFIMILMMFMIIGLYIFIKLL